MLLVVLSLEGLGKLFLQRAEQRIEAIAQRAAAAGRQTQRQRLVRALEVVDVAPIVGHGPVGGLALQILGNRGGLARARGAQSIDVVAVGGDIEAELNSARGALLADDLVQLFQIVGGVEGQIAGQAGSAQLVGG